MAVVRHLRDKFRKGKIELPKGLDFLEGPNIVLQEKKSKEGSSFFQDQ